MIKLDLDHYQEIAAKRGGRCLSTTYVGSHSKMTWECSEGHQWDAVAYSIKRGIWCPKCGNHKKTIEQMRAIAKSRGGKCLSEEYVHSQSKLRWECKKGHRWESKYNSIKDGCWCPQCAGLGRTIDDLRQVAHQHDGKCLSSIYTTSADKYLWECSKGHKFKTSLNTINGGCWCPKCAGFGKTIDDMIKLAQQHDGKCLSQEYINTVTPLTWECSKRHIWKTSPQIVVRGSWCPMCKDVSEQKCRSILEKLSQQNFPATKKVFGNGYELDMYNTELKLAFEFDGIQHYIFIPYWHKTVDRFEEQQKRDRKKDALCIEYGIALERIHYKIAKDDAVLESFIREKLIKHNVPLKGEHLCH